MREQHCCGGGGRSAGPHILLRVPQLRTIILQLRQGNFSWGSSPRLAELCDLEQHGEACRWSRCAHDGTGGAGLPPCFRLAGGRDWLCSRLLQNKYGSIWSVLSASLLAAPPLAFSPAALMRQLRSLTRCQLPPNFSPHLTPSCSPYSQLYCQYSCAHFIKQSQHFQPRQSFWMHKSSFQTEQPRYCVHTDNTAS